MELQGFVLFLLKCECGRPIQGLADIDQPIWWPSDVAFEDDLLKKASKKGVTFMKHIITCPDTLCLKILTRFLLLSLRADVNFETFADAFLPIQNSSNFVPIFFKL